MNSVAVQPRAPSSTEHRKVQNTSNRKTPRKQFKNLPQQPLSLITKCSSLKELKQIQAITIKTDLQNDMEFLIKFVNFCTQNPTSFSMDHARKLFDKIPRPGIILLNSMARGYARADDLLQAMGVLIRIMSNGLLPDDYTFSSILKACASVKSLEEGKKIHSLAIKLGLDDDMYVCPSLVTMYTECNCLGLARQVFNKVDEPCVVCYNALITGYWRSNMPNEALQSFREMQKSKIKPTYVTMLSVLSSCASLGSLQLGKWMHEYVKNHGFLHYVKVSTALIDMYAKCGSLDDAVSVFDNMIVRDTPAWSAIIVAYAIHGYGQEAIAVFQEMIRAGRRPDDVTFLGVLYACNHAGLVDQARRYFYNMRHKYGIVPGIKHYGCMVDCLGRAGRLYEAYSFLQHLPIKPTPILWRTLLSACSNHENVELAKKVAEQIFELDDTHGGDYVILSNLCARAGKWEDVDNLRKLMNERGAAKVPGCSSIEINNVVHEFFSGDGTRSEYKMLQEAVDELVKELKVVGYVPDLSLVHHANMEDTEKEATLRYHSEKLAIAFGLLNTTPGTTIRVVKNLRVCRDCHSAATLISSMCGREIVLRDVQRFHHFKDGQCSCGGYW